MLSMRREGAEGGGGEGLCIGREGEEKVASWGFLLDQCLALVLSCLLLSELSDFLFFSFSPFSSWVSWGSLHWDYVG